MEMNNLTIVPPEGMEAYQEGNEIKFRPSKQTISYDDIARELFFEKGAYFTTSGGAIKSAYITLYHYKDLNNCISEKQVRKLLAINQLMNVAKYLNGDWEPNWDNCSCKYYLSLHLEDNSISIECAIRHCSEIVHFRTMELAEQAIEILGEETIRLALSTDW